MSGDVRFVPGGGGPSPCSILSGDPNYYGVVSPAGGLTARAALNIRCIGGQYGSGVDYQVVYTYSMNRR